ncbi:head GIN domain-containing protein [Myxococcus sp. AB025B]|uniref:head GIN domain-containing protein n=1 Tax=Myxococcus TaxID=32 RepID=UPI0011443ABF|nr:head GIN domain-containing protein [Myxococcus sp. AB025B]
MKTARMSLLVPLMMFAGAAWAGDAQTRDVPDFHSIEVGHGIKAELKVGPRSVRVEGPADLLSRLELEVEDGELATKVERKGLRDAFNGGKVRLFITVPRLEEVSVSGGGSAQGEVATSEDFSIEASGGATIDLRGIDTRKLDLEASGGGTVQLEGRAKQLDIEASGGAVVKAMKLAGLKDLEVEASGGAQVEADPSESLEVQASGGTTVKCVSRPDRTQVQASGGSRVLYAKD